MVLAGGDQRGKRLGEKERIDLVKRQLAVLNCAQELRVCPAAGAERFHRQRVATALPQMVEQQAGQQSLADAGVSAGDENDARRAGPVHSRDLITASIAGILINEKPAAFWDTLLAG